MKKLLGALMLSTILCSCSSLDNTQCSCDCCHCSDTIESTSEEISEEISEESLFLPPSLTYEQLLENIKQAYIKEHSNYGGSIYDIYNIRYIGYTPQSEYTMVYYYVCDMTMYNKYNPEYVDGFYINYTYKHYIASGGSN